MEGQAVAKADQDSLTQAEERTPQCAGTYVRRELSAERFAHSPTVLYRAAARNEWQLGAVAKLRFSRGCEVCPKSAAIYFIK